jgi:hypothetical protein
MYWEGAQPPELNELCIKMWKDMNPGWEHTVIDDNVIEKTFPGMAKTFKEIPRTVAHKADMVRLQWLAHFGGVWADASVLPVMPLDAFAPKLVAPSGFFAYECESYCERFPSVASWFLVAEPNNRLVVAWRDELLERWKGDVPTSVTLGEAKADPNVTESGEPWNYYEVGYALENLIKESQAVRSTFNRMPKVSADWPEQCNMADEGSDDGCLTFWEETTSENRPPVLKRPGVIGNHEWLDSYHIMVASKNRTRDVTSVGPKTWDKKKWNQKYLSAILAKKARSVALMRKGKTNAEARSR